MKRYLTFFLGFALMGQLYAQERYAGGLKFDDEAYEGSPITVPLVRDVTAAKLPQKASVKAYAPTPGNQGQYNNCVGWSSAYAARSILFNKHHRLKTQDQVNANAFSPAFTYRLISKDQNCFTPTSIEHALRSLKEKGAIPKQEFDYNCGGSINGQLMSKARSYKISDYSRLFFLNDPEKLKLQSVKNALAEGNPVIIGMKCTPSFERSDGMEVWNRAEANNTTTYFGHAMCVVGYDNKKFGGAFEIMNSWGQRWGKGGFIWVKYEDFINFAKYAYLPMGASAKAAVAAAQKPKSKSRPVSSASSSNATSSKSIASKKQTSVSSQSSTSFGTTSSELLDLAGEVKLVQANGEEMLAKLYGNIYRTKKQYNSGTKFRLYLSSLKNAYVYVLGTDASYQTSQLFPKGRKGTPYLNAGTRGAAVPDSKHFIELDYSQANKNYLCIIYSQEVLDIALVQRKISTATGSLSARVQTALGGQLVSPRNLQYENGRVAFSAVKSPATAVALIVETRSIQ